MIRNGKRTIVIACEFRIMTSVPADWDRSMIEFHLNNTCRTNHASELAAQIEHFELDPRHVSCCCQDADPPDGNAHYWPAKDVEYLRDATEEDEKYYGTGNRYGPSDEGTPDA